MKLGTLALGSGFVLAAVLALMGASSATPAGPSPEVLVRGKYLVDQVAMCGDCHSQHDEKGQLIQEKYLKGSVLPFKAIVPMPVWADKAPSIAGLPGWEQNAAIKFFMTGVAYNDLPARPPMPQYRFTKQDAAAVVAYLRSLSLE